MCGHSLEVNVTTSLDFYLSVAQVQLLQQLLKDNMLGSDAPEKRAEVHHINRRKTTQVEINKFLDTSFCDVLCCPKNRHSVSKCTLL